MADEITVESLQAEIETMKADSKKATDALIAQNELLTADSDKWKAKHSEAEKHRKKQEADARKASEAAAQASGDVDAINQSWQEKFDNAINMAKETESGLNKIINYQTVETAAHQMASSIALDGCDSLIMPHIESRLYSEIVDGKAVLKIKDKDGKPSALTLDELKAEFSENKAYERIIRGSSASGNGAAGSNGAKGGRSISREEFNKMSPMSQGVYMSEKGTVHD